MKLPSSYSPVFSDRLDSFQVELCKSFGDPTKPKAWSKHSQKAPASEKQTKEPLASAAPAGTKKVSPALLCWVSVPGEGGLGCGEGDRAAGTPDSGVLVLVFSASGSVPCAVGIACASNKPLWVFPKGKKKKDAVDNLKEVS